MPFDKAGKILVKIFGSRNERLIRAYSVIARQAGEFEEQVKKLDDEALKAKTGEFKAAIKAGTRPEDILPETFAVVREAARRNVKMRHFDVQLIGGDVLYEGKIAEMVTGEGKTLVATLAAYLVHLTGRKVHIVTVNDYLAKRDAEWMGPIYKALGLTVGAIQADMDTAGDERKGQYACDITYGTNNEFGFDYLRDNMKVSLERMVQGLLQYAIIDEVDSILIDEARTPLIISGPVFGDIKRERYRRADDVSGKLIERQERDFGPIGKISYDEVEAPSWSTRGLVAELETELEEAQEQLAYAKRQLELARDELSEAEENQDAERIEEVQRRIAEIEEERTEQRRRITKVRSDALFAGGQVTAYFEIDYKNKSVRLTERGVAAAQEIAKVGSFYTGSNMEWPHLLEQSLRAHITFKKEKDYVVQDKKVVIVDEFTGRLMHGRQWSDGLHQAIEAREKVPIKEETQTLATITLQNFFRLYDQIAGMTGTAVTEAEEFMKIYNLDVVVIPTNEPCIREDLDDVIYKTKHEKINAIVQEINEISAAGRPILVGTTSVEKNESLAIAIAEKLLSLKIELDKVPGPRREKQLEKLFVGLEEGLGLEILNAKNHAREALIVEKAGQQHRRRDGRTRGNITIATNMAGRGTDIKLGPGVADIGGLYVLGTERHEARRIDNQLRGRTGRQGDRGSSQFFLSFDDDLMQIFAPDWTVKALSWIGWEEGQPIYHKRISKGIEKAQKKVEQRNLDIRSSLVEYDEVMDYQRKEFYRRRRRILGGKGLAGIIQEMIASTVSKYCNTFLHKDYACRSIVEWARLAFEVDLKLSDVTGYGSEQTQQLESLIKEKAKENARSNISLSLGEYLQDPAEPRGWDIAGMCNWAANVLGVSLRARDVKHQSAEEIEEHIVESVAGRIDEIDCSPLAQFLEKDFAKRRLGEWAKDRFNVDIDIESLQSKTASGISEFLIKETSDKYRRREIEFPVEYAMAVVYGKENPNVYDFEWLVKWAEKKYNAGFSIEQVQSTEPAVLYRELIELSESCNNGGFDKEINAEVGSLSISDLAAWANERFDASVAEEDLAEETTRLDRVRRAAREFLRCELTKCERALLLSFYDNAWKDHLYAMDHLRDSVWMTSLEQKDPKVEYRREGSMMFREMLETLEDRIAEIILKVRGDSGVSVQSVWSVSETVHDEVGQFAMTERQRAAAQASQGEVKVKQIRLEQPKVGRNDPCPCGSGKKYKKCCGKNM